MTLQIFGIYFVSLCLIVGAVFALVGAIGILKFNDAMTRMHAPTKVGTVGIGAILLASIVYEFSVGTGSFHEFLIMAFLFVTAPISAMFISKVNIHTGATPTPPSPPRDDTWSTLNVPEADRDIQETTQA